MTAKNPKLIRGISRRLEVLFALYVAASVVYNAVFEVSAKWFHQADIVAYSRYYIQQGDAIDMGLLVKGISAKPTFLSTFGWWHETWAGIVPFWRPLTSQFFWLENHFFGFDRLDRWQWVGIFSHFVFVALLAAFTYRLTQRGWIAALAALCFAGAQAWFPMNVVYLATGQSVPGDIALDSWKNQPEMWAGSCTLAALLLALNGKWAWSLVCVGIGVCFKESGWFAFPMIPLALWAEGRARQIPRRVIYAAAATAVVLIVLRACAGWSVFYGYHLGAEHSGLRRYVLAVEGYFLNTLFSPDAAAALAACMIFALCLWRRANFYLRLAIGIAGMAGCLFVDSRIQETAFDGAAAQFLEFDLELGKLIGCLLFLIAAYALIIDGRYRKQAFSLLPMILISGAGMAAALQVTLHALYLTFALNSVLLAMGIAAVAQSIGMAISSRLDRRSETTPPAPNLTPKEAEGDQLAGV
jgi:hypothetical protein